MQKVVLIVDDNDTIRRILRNQFECRFEGSAVHEAKGGFDAIEKVPQVHPDLIVLDMSMPRLNGVDTAQKLRELQIDTPIILFTLFADEARKSCMASHEVNTIASKSDLTGLYTQVTTLLSR